jgi:threonine dehydrogenase-like Zn-dependent dehydrogenase
VPLLTDADPLGCDTFATHRVPLSEAPQMYSNFQRKTDGVVKVQLEPEL